MRSLCFFLLFISSSLFSQELFHFQIDSSAKRLYFQEVLQIDSSSIAKTKEKIKLWYASSFSNAKPNDMIETDNSISFEFVSSYKLSKMMIAPYDANHHCFIQIKEDRIRIKVSEIIHIKNCTLEESILKSDLSFRSNGQTLKQSIETDITNLIHKLLTQLSAKEENW